MLYFGSHGRPRTEVKEFDRGGHWVHSLVKLSPASCGPKHLHLLTKHMSDSVTCRATVYFADRFKERFNVNHLYPAQACGEIAFLCSKDVEDSEDTHTTFVNWHEWFEERNVRFLLKEQRQALRNGASRRLGPTSEDYECARAEILHRMG